MQLTILGCSGGVGTGLRTTTLLLDDDLLIDAGTGLGDLELDAMARLRHIFITHSHLDHIASIPFLVDSIFDRIHVPIVIHGQAVTLKALREHVFNNVIWPDFTRLPDATHPVLRFEPMAPGERRTVGDRTLEMIPVNHVVPAVGYRVETPTGAFAFSGDTSTNDSFWEALNRHARLDLLIVESAFTNADLALSRRAGHYCAQLLAADLVKLRHTPQLYITHNKPGEEDAIFAECREAVVGHEVKALRVGMRFTI
jgi:ribonuclease BN (tRNA processing enzyme)